MKDSKDCVAVAMRSQWRVAQYSMEISFENFPFSTILAILELCCLGLIA